MRRWRRCQKDDGAPASVRAPKFEFETRADTTGAFDTQVIFIACAIVWSTAIVACLPDSSIRQRLLQESLVAVADPDVEHAGHKLLIAKQRHAIAFIYMHCR